MDPDFDPLDVRLDEAGTDGYLIDADSTDADQFYLSGFDAPDPFVTLYASGTIHLLVSGLEYGRARTESRADTVSRLVDYGYFDRREERGRVEARALSLAEFLGDHGVDSVSVPQRFPIGTADGLRDRDVAVEPEYDDVLTEIRATKTDEEIGHVRRTQRANEAAMHAAEQLLGTARIEGDETVGGVLLTDEGDPLTSERVREEIEVTLLHHGCALDETIVACGVDAADPHDRGSGPLRAGESIVVDIFPRDKDSRYHADMTRTFVKGEPSETVREWFDLVDEARRAAIDAVEPGATGGVVHDAACDVFEDAGVPTLRSDPTTETGFIHSTGHGVGLEVHELPRISPDGDELEPGHVVTIEPGLYDPAVGGVRIEDLLVVTEDGHENLTAYPVELVVD